ncbi:MAG: hypothetical protein NW217_09530 [Hyphomicrobiaceae bacterium]|nr:hypothetical protein [Hyphomicrobiaceae bacterium]
MNRADEDITVERERSRRFIEVVYGSMALTSAAAAIWFQTWGHEAGLSPDKASGAALSFLALGLANLVISSIWPHLSDRLAAAYDRLGSDRDGR